MKYGRDGSMKSQVQKNVEKDESVPQDRMALKL